VRDYSRSLRALVGNCEDFLYKVPAMFELVVDIMGDGFEQTPKGHPEVAGEGVTYEWGNQRCTSGARTFKTPTCSASNGACGKACARLTFQKHRRGTRWLTR
jgi:hypothetical protein